MTSNATKLPAGTCTCYVANEIRLHGKSDRPHMFWCPAFDPMREPPPWASRPSEALDRRGVVAHLTGGNPIIDPDPISGGEHAMTERVLKAIEEVHAPPADAARMGAPRPAGNWTDRVLRDDARPLPTWTIQADAAAKLGLPTGMLIMGDFADPPAPEAHEQPLPEKNDRPFVYLLVLDDITQRVKIGVQRYGTPLQPFNGRDSLRDLYEEQLDALMYLRQLIFERDGK